MNLLNFLRVRTALSGLLLAVASFAAVNAGCAWGRFTKMKNNAPVVRLTPPDSYEGAFGVSLAAAEGEDRAELYVGGAAYARGGLVYSLGGNDDPVTNPTDEAHCPTRDGSDTCGAIERPLGLDRSWSPSRERDRCFISGYGTIAGRQGLWTRCDDTSQFVYPVPSDVRAGLSAAQDRQNPRSLQLAANRGPEQLIVAATKAQRRAWFYAPLTGDPIDIETPTASGEDFGAAVAVMRLATGHVLAVSAPSADEVWLYRVVDGSIEGIGCLRGESSFGRTLASGDVDGDEEQDLVIAASRSVVVHSGAVLGGLPAQALDVNCNGAEIADEGRIASLSCELSSEVSGCGASDFGVSVAVADVDGDGSGEIFVGAPKMAARNVTQAGAVLAYDKTGDFIQAQIISNGKKGNKLGASLVAVRQGARDVIVAGASGSREAYVLYCAAGSDGAGSARCN
jgi:hypothetical protein